MYGYAFITANAVLVAREHERLVGVGRREPAEQARRRSGGGSVATSSM